MDDFKKETAVDKEQLDKMWMIRKTMQDSNDFLERFLKKIKTTKTNDEFFEQMTEEMKRKGMKHNK